MKLKPGFILRPFGDHWVAVAVGDARQKNLMLSMNKTGAFLWECLQEHTTEPQLLTALTDRYQVSPGQAAQDVEQLLQVLKKEDMLEM